MKAYFSYWNGGWQEKVNDFIIKMHKISVSCAKKHFKEVHFLTNEESKDYFKDIPFDSVTNIFDNLDKKYRPVWSVSKLLAFQHICQQGDPFIHIDYDVFLWRDIRKELYKADIFAQCEEKNAYESYQIGKFLEHFPQPGLIGLVNPKPKNAANAGILGGNNLNLLDKYAKHGLEIIFNKQNEDSFLRKNIFDHHWSKPVIVEQYLFTCACQYYNIQPEFLFPNGWPDEKEVFIQGYTHLMLAKQDKDIQNKVNLIADKITNI